MTIAFDEGMVRALCWSWVVVEVVGCRLLALEVSSNGVIIEQSNVLVEEMVDEGVWRIILR